MQDEGLHAPGNRGKEAALLPGAGGQRLRKPGEMRVGRWSLKGSFCVGRLRRAGGDRQRTLARHDALWGRVRPRFSRHGHPNCDCLSGEKSRSAERSDRASGREWQGRLASRSRHSLSIGVTRRFTLRGLGCISVVALSAHLDDPPSRTRPCQSDRPLAPLMPQPRLRSHHTRSQPGPTSQNYSQNK